MDNNILNYYKGKAVYIETHDDEYVGKVIDAVGDWLRYTDAEDGTEQMINLRFVVRIMVIENFEQPKPKKGLFGRSGE